MSFCPMAKAGILFSTIALAGTSMAATVIVDGNTTVPGVSYPTLSGAISYTNTQGAEPHVINVTTDSIVDGDNAYITEAVTIDGDADNDNIPCDILVDISSLQALPVIGNPFQVYMKVASPGNVTISDLNIHPDEVGNIDLAVAGLETDNPPSGLSNYTFTRVNFSGSTAAGAFINPNTDANLYAAAGNILWTSQRLPGADTGGIIHVFRSSEDPTAGNYNVTFDHCNVAMANGSAINVNNRSGDGTTTFLGGIYGHSGQAAFLVRGNNTVNVTIKGTYADRVKLVRCNQVNAANKSALHFINSARITLVEYVDSYLHADDCFGITLLGGSAIEMMRYCRFWHGTDPENPAALTGGRLIRTANSATITMDSSTLYLDNSVNVPADDGNASHDVFMMFTDAGNVHNGIYTLTNSIFASDGPANGNLDGYFNLSGDGTSASYSITYSALPHDGVTAENINNPLFVPGTEPAPEKLTLANNVSVSPIFADITYDFADPANVNFLRPTNAAYNAAASDGGMLIGGVGEAPASVEEWMLF